MVVTENSRNVLAKESWIPEFPCESYNFGPEIAFVVFPKFLSRNAMWLAWETGSDEIHLATPRFTFETFDITPDRRVR